MRLFPAIDLYEGKAVRLIKGDYKQMTVYSNDPAQIALDFISKGCSNIHIVDLEGAKSGETPNFETVKRIKSVSGAFCEIGGGSRDMKVVEKYLAGGLDRVILGTAAVKDRAFLKKAVETFKDKIAVGVDIKDGKVAIRGWIEKTEIDPFEFCGDLKNLGVEYIICTDISRDGMMKGVNGEICCELKKRFGLNITASGGVTSLDDLIALEKMDLYAAIIGKAYYEGAIDLRKATEIIK